MFEGLINAKGLPDPTTRELTPQQKRRRCALGRYALMVAALLCRIGDRHSGNGSGGGASMLVNTRCVWENTLAATGSRRPELVVSHCQQARLATSTACANP